jgi:hypothetical protein
MNKDKMLRAREMFPELANREDLYRFVEFIKVDDYKLFCKRCMQKANITPNDYNNKVAEIVLDLLIRKELLTKTNHQTYVDSLLVAAFLHNAYYGKEESFDEYSIGFDPNISSLLKARQEFDEIADMDDYEFGPIPEQFREMIWDTIEGQLGDCTPMAKTKPSPNSPQDLFATAIWLTRVIGDELFQIFSVTKEDEEA